MKGASVAGPVGPLLIAFVSLSLAYALLLPSFEGPDESEHVRYIEAVSQGVTIEPPSEDEHPEWGYQIFQPPLYYWLMGVYARVVEPEFPRSLKINESQNARFPFIRHDLPEEQLPWAGPHRGLRVLRLPSVLFGWITAAVLLALATLLFGQDPWARALFLSLGLLSPNILQGFSVVGNDSLVFLLITASILAAVRLTRAKRDPWAPWVLCGIGLAMALITKLTAFIGIMTVATLLITDAASRDGWRRLLRGGLLLGLPLLLIGGAFLLHGYVEYGDPTRQSLAHSTQAAFLRPEPASVLHLLGAMLSSFPGAFLADLCWQSYGAPWPGRLLFGVWVAGGIGWLTLLLRRSPATLRFGTVAWLPLLALFWAGVFSVLVNRKWTTLQLRHLLSIWPVLMLLLVYPVVSWEALWTRGKRWIVWGTGTGLVALNLWLLLGLEVFHRPAADPALDRDYHSFLYSYSRERARGLSYLTYGTHLNHDVQRHLAERDWAGTIELVENAEPGGSRTTDTVFAYALSLAMTERSRAAFKICEGLAPSYPKAQPLHVELALSLGDATAAAELLRTYLPDSTGDLRVQLLRQSARVEAAQRRAGGEGN